MFNILIRFIILLIIDEVYFLILYHMRIYIYIYYPYNASSDSMLLYISSDIYISTLENYIYI